MFRTSSMDSKTVFFLLFITSFVLPTTTAVRAFAYAYASGSGHAAAIASSHVNTTGNQYGARINGTEIPVESYSSGNTPGKISVQLNQGGLVINGNRYPTENQKIPLEIVNTDVQPSGLNSENELNQPDIIEMTDDGFKTEDAEKDSNIATEPEVQPSGLNSENEPNQFKIIEITQDGFETDNAEKDSIIPTESEDDPNQLGYENFEKHQVKIITEKQSIRSVYGSQDLTIKVTNNSLMINGKQVPGVDKCDEVVIDYHEEGGITVNGKRKDGFTDIKGIGKTTFPCKLDPDDVDYYGKTISE